MSEKKSWGLILTISGAMAGAITSAVIDYFKDKPVFSTLWSIVKWFGNLILSIWNFDIKAGWIIIVLVTLVFILYIISKFQKEETEDTKPDFYDYTEDNFKNWKYTWEWKFSSARKAWIICDFKVHCPECDTSLIPNGPSFHCPRCNFFPHNTNPQEFYEIEHLILDNIKRKRKAKGN